VLVELRGIARERIEVVELGVDHGMFFSQVSAAARVQLGIHPDVTVLLYVGGLDIYHDLGPVIETIGNSFASVPRNARGCGVFRVAVRRRLPALANSAQASGRRLVMVLKPGAKRWRRRATVIRHATSCRSARREASGWSETA
jgi:hypothetical protein